MATRYQTQTLTAAEDDHLGRPGGLAGFLTGRGTAWLVIVAYVAAMLGLGLGLGQLSTAPRGSNLPPASESQLVADTLARFPDAAQSAVLVVAHRPDGKPLEESQIGQFSRFSTELNGGKPVIIPAEDRQAVLSLVTVPSSEDDSRNKDVILDLRHRVAEEGPDGLTLQVTGGPAFGADIANSFSGANVTLLLVTVGIVAVLLLLTYRSPVLWLVPLTVVALADQAATPLTNAISLGTGWHAEGGIVSVLVFGAGTNYALLLISRYREELLRTDDHRQALRRAWRGSRGAIIASNLTVVLGLLTLVFAVLPNTRGLGLSAAAGLVLALVSVLFALPAVLAVVGRRVFWPFIPQPGQARADQPGLWGTIARRVVGRPVAWFVGGVALLGVMASSLLGVSVGLDQADQFRVEAESIDGLQTVAQHYPAGFTAPITVVADEPATARVLGAVKGVEGVQSVNPTGSHDGIVRLQVIGRHAPGTPEALDMVRDLRTAVHAVDGADARVGGSMAQDLDQRAAQRHDFLLVAPLVLAVSLLVLIALTRSLVAPVLLLAINLTSAAAAIGAGGLLSAWLMGSPALALEVPLFAFIFLVALGIDYTIFLIERARHEADLHGTRQGMVEAVRHTGAVITSAGIVLAAVFAALGVLPLVVMGQLGIIVCLGVLVDTLVVRTIIVPALFGLLGDRVWWPRRVAPHDASPATGARARGASPRREG